MVTFLIVLAIVVAAVVVWRRRVPLLARLLGQSESRVDRQLNRRREP
jgi:O-antigen ligase